MNLKNSIAEFNNAKKSIPGGVNSPVRAYKSVGSNPVFISKAKGSKIIDIDGNEYIDFVSSWGPMILGHAHEQVVNAIVNTTQNGTSYGAPTILETKMAEQIKQMFPSIEIVRMVNSGTEATMSALRLARGYTSRDKVVKFEGCYHGHVDSFLIKAGSGAITLGLPDSPGVTKGTAKDTLLAIYNDLDSVKKLFQEQGDEIAALIIEPIAGNMGVIIPDLDFLKGVREITEQYGAVLIFDEVISGFRVAKGGAQELYGITPDLTTLGKIIGGGLPVGAYGGKKEIMDNLAPAGAVYQAGTLSGNPLAMAAGLETLKIMNETDGFYDKLEEKAARLEKGLLDNIEKTGTKAIINRVGSLMTMFFTDLKEVKSFEDAMKSDTEKYAKYFNIALESGVYLAPSQFECAFISAAHTDEDIDKTIEANYIALKQL
ncbi:MAG: glutamate-1-semialdehyde 2,1-aminomutase [Bacteroidales bacterium]|jgi:glutamate-1-semialdehyde 2,1-aminomutase|nr:glutamate-1-semialdehyde 2,1-aminomutase [Bacteroidales bacterium]